jgi:hypothetical protein
VRVGLRQRRLIAAAITFASALALAAPSLIDGLATDDPAALATAVAEIERAPASPELADALFGAARACEDRLRDPARALALYQRILLETPDARVATAASVRAQRLQAVVGAHGEHAAKAAAFAQLVARADMISIEELVMRADALAAMSWPGAGDAALWTADVLRRNGLHALAQPRYAEVMQRWPAKALAARRSATGNAIEAHDWALAEELAAELPAVDPTDVLIRDNLVEDLTRARRTARRYLIAWIVLALSALGLLASLTEAMLRGGIKRPSWRPPFEVMFLAPVALVLVVVSFATRAVIAPAVAQITGAGIAAAWLSGITLDLLRARGRRVHARSLAHIVACGAAAVAIGYIAIVHGELIDLLAETVQAGPGA